VALREAATVLRDQRAQDAAQEATLRAWRHAHHCRTPERPAPWVRAIARREALRIAAGERTSEPFPDAAQDGGFELAELRVDVARALDGLSAHERRLLAGRYWRDLTECQLAAELGLPVGTAKTQLHRARHRLRELLFA
jgi:RNA polymerase sigma-70 factor (ECF subfamily)